MSDRVLLPTLQQLLEDLKDLDNWYLFGAFLGVPVNQLRKIESSHHGDIERCKLDMLQYWLDSTVNASWKKVARALEQTNQLVLATAVKKKYLRLTIDDKEGGIAQVAEEFKTLQASTATTISPPHSIAALSSVVNDEIEAEVKIDIAVVEDLQGLESLFSRTLVKVKCYLQTNCDLSDAQLFLDTFLSDGDFSKCDSFDELIRQLDRDYIDIFNTFRLRELVACFEKDELNELVKAYEEKKLNFLTNTTVLSFQRAVVSRVEPVLPKGKAVVTIKIPKEMASRRTLKDIEELAMRGFEECHKSLIRLHAVPGSVIISWVLHETLCSKMEQLVRDNAIIFKDAGVEEVTVGGQKVFPVTQQEDTQSPSKEIQQANQGAIKHDLSLKSNCGYEYIRRVEDDGLQSLSPFFERRLHSLELPAYSVSWSESGHAELTTTERSTHRQRIERESRSATPTKDHVDNAAYLQLYVGSSKGCSSRDWEVGRKAALPTTWRNEDEETVFLFDDERSVEATSPVNIDEFVIVDLTSSGSFGQVPPPPPPRKRSSGGHIHQWWSVDSANGGGHTMMIYRSSSHEQLSSLAAAEEVDSPYNGRGKPNLHLAKSVKCLTELLEHPEADPDGFNEAMDAPIHTYIRRQYKERAELLLTLFSNGAADMDLRDGDHLTPLHLAAQMNDTACVKVLVAVGADELAMNAHNQIPMDLAKDKLKELLMQLHSRPRFARCSSKESYVLQNPKKLGEQLHPDNIVLFALKLEDEVNRQMDMSADVTQDAVALIMQQREIKDWKKTMTREQLSRALYPQVLSGSGNLGSRILFLDGGGMRALVEIEILMDIERRTNHKITELFDWIVGTSTGGIIALGLVYAQKSLLELKRLYLRLRSDAYGGGILKIMDKSAALDRILKKEFGTKIAMCDVEHPKVMICAVDKGTTDLRVKFFNNLYDDSPELTNIPVWMAARAAAAGPTYFTSFMNCVDGGVKANNPSEYAMMEIHNYYRRRGRPSPEFKIIVSVGTGKFPPKDMGNTDLGLRDTILTPKHLFDLLINTISTSEEIALKFKTQCERENIPFFRFNPRFTEEIPPDEINGSRLVDMILRTKLYLVSVQCLDSAYQMMQIFSKLLQ